jgi:hypothetical protein
VGKTFIVTPALLFVALLFVIELSYRRWVRRMLTRRRDARAAISAGIDLEGRDADLIQMPERDVSSEESRPNARRSG